MKKSIRKFIDKLIAQFDENFNFCFSEYKKYTTVDVIKRKGDDKWLSILEKKIPRLFLKFLLIEEYFQKISLLSKKKL